MTALVLDGAALAARRARDIAAAAAVVRQRRGRPPHLLIAAFADEHGRVPWLQRKLQAAAAMGIDVATVIIEPGADAGTAAGRLRQAVAVHDPDGVFVQVPFPSGFDGDAFAEAIPVALDIDIMTGARTDRYMRGADDLPPVTVSAVLLLLDAHGIVIDGRAGVIVADESPFARMFAEALRRRGAHMEDPVPPTAADLPARLRPAGVVLVAAGHPGLVRASDIAPGAVALDAGYFNPGGRGDIDLSPGTDHLAAVMPVPGGVGPMTVSALLERTVAFAAAR